MHLIKFNYLFVWRSLGTVDCDLETLYLSLPLTHVSSRLLLGLKVADSSLSRSSSHQTCFRWLSSRGEAIVPFSLEKVNLANASVINRWTACQSSHALASSETCRQHSRGSASRRLETCLVMGFLKVAHGCPLVRAIWERLLVHYHCCLSLRGSFKN